MLAKHSMRIDLDADGNLVATHRVAVLVAGHTVNHSAEIALEDKTAAVAAVKALIDANRVRMEEDATAFAVQHVSAVANKARKGEKRIKLAGTLGAVGGAASNKKGK